MILRHRLPRKNDFPLPIPSRKYDFPLPIPSRKNDFRPPLRQNYFPQPNCTHYPTIINNNFNGNIVINNYY